MKRKTLLIAVLIVVVLASLVTGISLMFQPGQSTWGILFIAAAAVLGVAALLSGLKDTYDFVEKFFGHEKKVNGKSRSGTSKTNVSAKNHSVAIGGNAEGDVTNVHKE